MGKQVNGIALHDLRHGLINTGINSMNTITVGILTLNEARNIADCIRSVAFADEIILVDSGSTDETLILAQQTAHQQNLTLHIHQYPDWQGFAEQRNRLLKHVKSDFIFFLDADERVTPELQAEIQNIVAHGSSTAWQVHWLQIAFGQPLKWLRSSGRMLRLFRRDTLLGFDGVVHERALTLPADLPCRKMKNRLLHYSRYSVHDSLLKLAQYTQLGAYERKLKGKKGGVFRGILSGSVIFIRLYVIEFGLLCGGAGFVYCYLRAVESFFRYTALKYDHDLMKQISKRY